MNIITKNIILNYVVSYWYICKHPEAHVHLCAIEYLMQV